MRHVGSAQRRGEGLGLRACCRRVGGCDDEGGLDGASMVYSVQQSLRSLRWISGAFVPAAVVSALIAAGADVNMATTTDEGCTPLHAAASGGHTAVVRALIAAGADLDRPTIDDDSTPLIIAAQFGHTATAVALVAAGADVRKATSDIGCTPVYVAARDGHAATVEVPTPNPNPNP